MFIDQNHVSHKMFVCLQNHADYLITVPEVVKEIKNKRQLKRLCVLPYDLVVDEPAPESIKHVIEFAKKTGDYLSLSSADIKVIALTYQLEKELIGSAHLRNEPIVAKTIASKQKPAELLDQNPLVGFYNPPSSQEDLEEKGRQNRLLIAENIEEEEEKHRQNQLNDAIEHETSNDGQSAPDDAKDDDDAFDEHDEQLAAEFSKLDCNLVSESDADQILVAVRDENQSITEVSDASDDSDNESGSGSESDRDDWITPKNVVEMKSACGKEVAEDTVCRVACMSTDFAVQNVLKQINLNIAALDGRIIKQMRTYILRCYGCFKTTSIMTKIFCPNCGHKTLKRVAVSMNEQGQQVIHINLRRPLTAKGKNQSIPRPQGGKHSSNPILFEDQPIPKQMPSRVARTKTNALDEDYIAGESLLSKLSKIHQMILLIHFCWIYRIFTIRYA